jgi:hypothetical protein
MSAADYDSPWKEALDVYFEAFLALPFLEAHAQIDWTRGYESVDFISVNPWLVMRDSQPATNQLRKLRRNASTAGPSGWMSQYTRCAS